MEQDDHGRQALLSIHDEIRFVTHIFHEPNVIVPYGWAAVLYLFEMR
jgi:hypothetical protein